MAPSLGFVSGRSCLAATDASLMACYPWDGSVRAKWPAENSKLWKGTFATLKARRKVLLHDHSFRLSRPSIDGASRRGEQPDPRRRGGLPVAACGQHPNQEPGGERRREASLSDQPGSDVDATGAG